MLDSCGRDDRRAAGAGFWALAEPGDNVWSLLRLVPSAFGPFRVWSLLRSLKAGGGTAMPPPAPRGRSGGAGSGLPDRTAVIGAGPWGARRGTRLPRGTIERERALVIDDRGAAWRQGEVLIQGRESRVSTTAFLSKQMRLMRGGARALARRFTAAIRAAPIPALRRVSTTARLGDPAPDVFGKPVGGDQKQAGDIRAVLLDGLPDPHPLHRRFADGRW